MHPAHLHRDELLTQCQVRRQRRSGPGGQHRNKVETGIVLTHLPTGTRVEATEGRSQHRNLEAAITRLRIRLAILVRSTERPATPSALWQSRLHGKRVRISPTHDDFPVLLAEVFDSLQCADWEPREAAAWLGCSSSQLVKFVKLEPQAFVEVNRQRDQLGLHSLL